jgi:regulator of sigma E protease
MLNSIVAAVIILGLLIIVHELGHFFMAKRLGVRVVRFSIGFPPRLFGIRRGETEYAVGALPFGGYVKMLGDEIGEEPKPEELQGYLNEIALDVAVAARRAGACSATATPQDAMHAIARQVDAGGIDPSSNARAVAVLGREPRRDELLLLAEVNERGSLDGAIKALSERAPRALVDSFRSRSFPSQPLWRRTLIVLAGPLANILFAPLLLAMLFMYGVPQLEPIVGQVAEDLPAASAGIRPGDRIVALDGRPIGSWIEFSDLVKSSDGSPLRLEIERREAGSTARTSITITPARRSQETVYGTTIETWLIGISARGDQVTKRFGPIEAIIQSSVTSVLMTGQLMVGIYQIISGETPVRGALGGPIMIAQLAGRQASEGLANVVLFTVMLSIQLGIINLLPVPLLDGGHLLFFAYEGVRGKPLALRQREVALQVGLFLLVALMAFVIFNDISRIVQG